ncbi:hypothetical protein J2Y63_002442 [Shinella sp. BE166]|uniref:HNH endonuclease signature motif containing protein n=1 Tax=Shinella sp. BE166 TaxID=3373918 RepID=UPI003EBDFEFA
MAKTEQLPSLQDVLKRLSYDSSTGLFIWKERPRSDFGSDRAWNVFNASWKGKIAGHTSTDGYTRIEVDGRNIRAHRLAWFVATGEWPREIDHINGDRKDNRIANLRNVNRRENSRNRCIRSDNTTGATGIFWSEKTNRWIAKISSDQGAFFIGAYPEYGDAVFARKVAEKCFGYHQNHGRKANG